MTTGTETPYGVRTGELSGTATFRMMPTDDVATDPSGATVTSSADGRALSVAYWWTHPEDQRRHEGHLLLGVPADDGEVAAAWIDAWHQQTVVALSGRATETGALVGYEYAPGWHWELVLEVTEDVPCLVMRNVVPADGERQAAAYEVSRTAWS